MPDFEPDHDIIEEKSRDWFPFIVGMGVVGCGVLVIILELFVVWKGNS